MLASHGKMRTVDKAHSPHSALIQFFLGALQWEVRGSIPNTAVVSGEYYDRIVVEAGPFESLNHLSHSCIQSLITFSRDFFQHLSSFYRDCSCSLLCLIVVSQIVLVNLSPFVLVLRIDNEVSFTVDKVHLIFRGSQCQVHVRGLVGEVEKQGFVSLVSLNQRDSLPAQNYYNKQPNIHKAHLVYKSGENSPSPSLEFLPFS